MQYVLRYRIASDKAGALREWLRENTADIEAHAPDGWHYAGSYFVVRGFGDYDCEMRYDLDDYAAMDSENPPRFNEIVREWQRLRERCHAHHGRVTQERRRGRHHRLSRARARARRTAAPVRGHRLDGPPWMRIQSGPSCRARCARPARTRQRFRAVPRRAGLGRRRSGGARRRHGGARRRPAAAPGRSLRPAAPALSRTGSHINNTITSMIATRDACGS